MPPTSLGSEPEPESPTGAASTPVAAPKPATSTDAQEPLASRLQRMVFGKPRDLRDKRIFHQISLIPFLAWVGLGADGLSSSAYGPEEAFRNLGSHIYLAIGLAAMTAL